jgi:hypothetical protein
MDVRYTPRKSADVILHALLRAYTPDLSKDELNCLMVEAMQDAGLVTACPSELDLMRALRIPPSRAKKLLTRLDLRRWRRDDDEHDRLLRGLLRELRVQKEDGSYAFVVRSSLLLEHVNNRVQNLGYTAQVVHGADLVQLSEQAIVALIDAMLPTHARPIALERAESQGIPDRSVKGYIEDAVRTLGPPLANGESATAADSAWSNLANLLVSG